MEEFGLTSSIVRRSAQALLEETLADTPVTVIQGARQVGKSTLARVVSSGRSAVMVSLDDSAALRAANSDPDAFARQGPDRLLVIDEVQRAPELLRAVKASVDDDRRPGRFLLTGSANLLRVAGTDESLAGRAETVVLYGLSQGELSGVQEDFVDQLLAGNSANLLRRSGALTRHEYLTLACTGSYPEPQRRTARRRNAWFDNYVRRIVTRDAQDISGLAHLERLPVLLRLLAANTSGEMVKARLAGDSGLPETSLPPYLALLETLYLTHELPAWGANLTGRVTGRSKVSLLDTGLVARLNNVTPEAMAPGAVGNLAGGLLESFVAGELRRQLSWAEQDARLFHFRDRDGREVDIVVESPDRRIAGIEMKAAGLVDKSDFRGLAYLRDKVGHRFTLGVVLYTGRQALPFGDRLLALPYSALWTPPTGS